ncbi:aryldialkylphosphatase [Microbacterium sp. PRC9]|uniref:phosphotriesterase family protein n=1 Tax=Microbacterium sp. PRC9 TaxID=2962591 RepID=UPI0028818538|nr:aryldialkylphosphatase [Microbacterium sp. PRC9]MDT0144524.1 aryldialkylphosphatase [Microbacterium sp. PRC9]
MTDGPRIRTVLGDISPEVVGDTDYHEHLFQVSRMLPGDELADVERSREEAARFLRAGVTLMVEATPAGLGARPGDVAEISRSTGLHVVHVTGLHHGGHYPDDHPLRQESEAALAKRFVEDITVGFRRGEKPAVRAGMLKAGIRYWSIGSFERRALAAVAHAHRETRAPVMIHLDHGSAAFEVLEVLGDADVEPRHIVLAHMDRNLDPGLHRELIATGARLGYDGWARHRDAPDSAIIDCLVAVAEAGGSGGVVLGGDVARASRYVAYGGMPGLDYVQRRVVPRLRERLDSDALRRVRRDNLVDLLAFVDEVAIPAVPASTSTPGMQTIVAISDNGVSRFLPSMNPSAIRPGR